MTTRIPKGHGALWGLALKSGTSHDAGVLE